MEQGMNQNTINNLNKFSGPIKTFLPMMNYFNKHSYFGSFYIYFKLFFFYPLKYMTLLSIVIAIYKIFLLIEKYGNKFVNNMKAFGQMMVDCGEQKKSCTWNYIIFKWVDWSRIFTGIFKFFLGLAYLCITIILVFVCIILLIPINLLLPKYNAIL